MATGKIIGYIRVSSVDQNTERQLEGVRVDKTFTDKASGKDTNRPQLRMLLDYVREGDTIVVHSLDRLARNLDDLRKLVQTLTAKDIKIHFIKENLIFTGDDSPMSNLLLSMLGAISEFERSLIRERQREGIAIAIKKGLYKGRKHTLSDEQALDIKTRASNGDMISVIARDYNLSRVTIYRYLKR